MSAYKFSPFIAFQVKDYNKAITFYRNVLGMQLVKEHPQETELEKGGLHFFAEDAPGKRAVYFEFEVPDIEAARQELTAHGCKVTKTYSEKSIMIEDPFGLSFHIFQP